MSTLTEQPPRPVVVVTGAGSGIGRAVTGQLLAAGYRVALAGRRLAPLEATAGDAALAEGSALCVVTDVSRPDDVGRLFDLVTDHWGRVDVLFNNAGSFGPTVPVEDIGLAEWEQTVGVNQTGALLCAAAAFRVMKAQQPQGGRIINNGSISSQSPRPHAAAYAMTKHAVAGLTKSLELEGRRYGITAGQIDIGNATTGMMASVGALEGALQADGRRLTEPTFDVAHAASAVVFMAGLPAGVTVNQLTMTAAGMPFQGRG